MATQLRPLPLPLTPGTESQKYYPSLDPTLPDAEWKKRVQEALRRIFDFAYQDNGQAGPLSAYALGNATVSVPVQTTAIANVPGAQIMLPRAGNWIVVGSFTFSVEGAGDVDVVFNGFLFVAGLKGQLPATELVEPPVLQKGNAKLKVQSQPTIVTVSNVWRVAVEAGATAKLQVAKASGTGTSKCDGANSAIAACWTGA
ncbi:MAG TPA: hypothetical protein VIV12_31315 [Streptosporangiaceae bacterium]